MTTGQPVPVLEVGGTHVSAAHVDLDARRVVAVTRREWDASASRAELVATIVDAVSALPPTGPSIWSIAIPGPFDYARGIGLFEGVGKLDALRSVDVGALLREALPAFVADVRFLNDAHAFALGEWVAGAACGHGRVLGLTLGTGVGSAFLADGRLVEHGPTFRRAVTCTCCGSAVVPWRTPSPAGPSGAATFGCPEAQTRVSTTFVRSLTVPVPGTIWRCGRSVSR